MTHKLGRPTDYKPEYCDEIREFFDRELTKTLKTVITGKNDYSREEEKEIANELPTFERFAVNIGVNKDTLYEWEKVHPEFSDSMEECRQIQQDFLVQNGLKGLYQSNFAIFVAKNYTGMRDKTEIEHSGSISVKDILTKENEDLPSSDQEENRETSVGGGQTEETGQV